MRCIALIRRKNTENDGCIVPELLIQSLRGTLSSCVCIEVPDVLRIGVGAEHFTPPKRKCVCGGLENPDSVSRQLNLYRAVKRREMAVHKQSTKPIHTLLHVQTAKTHKEMRDAVVRSCGPPDLKIKDDQVKFDQLRLDLSPWANWCLLRHKFASPSCADSFIDSSGATSASRGSSIEMTELTESEPRVGNRLSELRDASVMDFYYDFLHPDQWTGVTKTVQPMVTRLKEIVAPSDEVREGRFDPRAIFLRLRERWQDVAAHCASIGYPSTWMKSWPNDLQVEAQPQRLSWHTWFLGEFDRLMDGKTTADGSMRTWPMIVVRWQNAMAEQLATNEALMADVKNWRRMALLLGVTTTLHDTQWQTGWEKGLMALEGGHEPLSFDDDLPRSIAQDLALINRSRLPSTALAAKKSLVMGIDRLLDLRYFLRRRIIDARGAEDRRECAERLRQWLKETDFGTKDMLLPCFDSNDISQWGRVMDRRICDQFERFVHHQWAVQNRRSLEPLKAPPEFHRLIRAFRDFPSRGEMTEARAGCRELIRAYLLHILSADYGKVGSPMSKFVAFFSSWRP